MRVLTHFGFSSLSGGLANSQRGTTSFEMAKTKTDKAAVPKDDAMTGVKGGSVVKHSKTSKTKSKGIAQVAADKIAKGGKKVKKAVKNDSDSDDDSEDSASNATSDSSDSSGSDSEIETKTKKANGAAKLNGKANGAATEQAGSDSGSESGSDDAVSSDDSEGEAAPAVKINGSKPAVAKDESGSDSDSDSEEEAAPKAVGKTKANGPAKRAKEVSRGYHLIRFRSHD